MIAPSHTIVKPRFAGFIGLQDFPRICGGFQEIQMANGIFRGAFLGGGVGSYSARGSSQLIFLAKYLRTNWRQAISKILDKSQPLGSVASGKIKQNTDKFGQSHVVGPTVLKCLPTPVVGFSFVSPIPSDLFSTMQPQDRI